MEERQTLTILFWLEKSRVKNGMAQICVRITVDGSRAELRAQRRASIVEWDSKAQMIISKAPEAKEVNNHLAIVKAKILSCQSKIEARNELATAEAIKLEYLGKRPARKKLMDVFDFKLKRIKEEVSRKKTAPSTYAKYEDTYNHLVGFLKHAFNVADKYLDEINYSFIADFEHYLSVTKDLANNTSMKYVSITKSIFRMANQRGWLPVNPVAAFTCSFSYGEPLRLEYHELELMYKKEMPVKRLEEARDAYVFMCFTGFGYSDTRQLTRENLFWGIDKLQWISKERQKTDGMECVPLLPIPMEIIEKYRNHPFCRSSGQLLPIRSNSNFNGYLKEIAAICHINKELTTHTGRHTFATSVTLENGVPLETVGKMLGQSSIKSTQRYARVTRKKVSNNMNELSEKLFPNSPNLKQDQGKCVGYKTCYGVCIQGII